MTWLPPLDEHLRDAYLARLGLREAPAPSVEALFALHRAQLERVPYETTWIWLGERRTIEPLDSVRHLLAGRGGYCYHLNGALATLLGWLGFTVRWHVGGVRGSETDEAGPTGNHLALTVSGLPSPSNESGEWFVETGLGDGPHEPLPLLTGEYRQGPFTYGLAPVPGGWRFHADPRMSLVGMDFTTGGARPADFAAKHAYLQADPESSFLRAVTAFRRDADGLDVLRGRVLARLDGDGDTTTELASSADWFAALADVFGLPLSDVDDAGRAGLWRKVDRAHQAFRASRV